MFQLSKEGEQRLLQTLHETLKGQVSSAAKAFVEGNHDEIRRIGHSLCGNSGAAYFQLTRVSEIGKQFHFVAEMDQPAFSVLLLELGQIVDQLQRKVEQIN